MLQVQPAAAEQPVHDKPELAGQVTHAVAAVAPVLVEYVPVPQSVHAALPVATLYLPAAHGEHTPPSGPVEPVLQVQAVAAELGLGELELPGHAKQVDSIVAPVVAKYFPAAQSVHAALPVVILYLPVAHGEHTPPSSPVDPALHVQATTAVLGLGELELPGHATQADSTVAPAVAEYFAAAQSVHTALPVAILYLPATHDVHVPPSGPVKPTLHVQAVTAELGLGELELLGHVTQVDSSVAPAVAKYFAAAQSVHTA